jgi:hypothetical protein
MLLDERDTITTSLVTAILYSGLARLTPIQRDLLSGLFLEKMRAPMRCFKTKYAMSSRNAAQQPLGAATILWELANFSLAFSR